MKHYHVRTVDMIFLYITPAEKMCNVFQEAQMKKNKRKKKGKTSASFIVFKELHNALITVKTNRLSPHVIIVQAYN